MSPATFAGLHWAHGADAADLERLLEALYRVEGLLNRVTDVDGLLEAVTLESRRLVDSEASSLLLYDEYADDLYFHVALTQGGDADALRRSVRLRIGEGIAGTVAQTRESIHVPDASRDERVHRGADSLTKFETRSILAVPMAEGDRLIGVLEVLNKRSESGFTDFDQRVLEMFGGLAAAAIQRARLTEENLRSAQLAAVGEAVAGLSHHTKNILMGLEGSLHLVDEGLREKDWELLGQAWPVLKRSAGRLQRVVNDMLAYSKPREPMMESSDIAGIVAEAVDALRELLVRRDIDVTVDCSRVGLRVRCDAAALHHALLNLLTNAAEVVPAARGRIHVEAVQDTSGVTTISVEDNGPGVDPVDRDRIFQPFYSSKGAKGTGLGLAVTSKIVAEHAGTLRAERGRLGGARLVMTFPGTGPTDIGPQ